MARFHSRLAFAGCVLLLLAAVASPARAQSDLFLFTPGSNAVSVFTTNAGSTPTSITSIGGGGSTGGFASVVRGDQAFAYVSYNGASDSIQVINTATRSVVQTVAVAGGDPFFMVFSPSNSTLYVANGTSNNVLVYSVSATTGLLTQTSTITIGAGTQPRGLAVSPDGATLYVANQTSNSVSVVNTATNAITTTIPVGSQPVSIAINPAGTLVYVGNATSSNVSVINTATNTVATTINVGSQPIGIVVSPNGRYLYLTATSLNQVRVYDTSSNTLIGTFASASGPSGLAISPDGSTLYVMNGGSANGQAFSINASSGLLTSLGFFSTTTSVSSPGMCGNGGSSANGMLGSGGTFFATSNGALGCAGSSATMSGGTIVAGVNNLVMATPIVLASQGGAVDTNGNNLTLGGAISGTGSLTKIGLGILTLSGSSTYTGATNVNIGTLQAGAANAFSPFSAFTVASGATLDLSNFNQTIGSLAGAGNVTLGSGTLTTGGDNTSTTFSGPISGTGGLTKTGSGTLLLTGISTYAGATTVNAGTLSVNGSIANSALTVNAGGAIGGTGTIGNTTISGGTLSPGNSIGTLTVQGNLVLTSAAAYLVEVSPTDADRTNVTGTASLAGTVQAVFGPRAYIVRTYTILSAAGGLGGTTFNTLATSNLPGGFRASLSYTATDAILNLTATLGGNGLSINQQSVAGALNGFFNNGGALPPGFASVFGLTGGNLANALSQLSGEAATGAQQVAFQMTNQFLGLMLDPFVDGRSGMAGAGGPALGFAPEREDLPDDIALAYSSVLKAPPAKAPGFEQRWTVWGGAYGGSNRTSGDPAVVGSHDLAARAAGFAAGLDYHLTPNTVVGMALAGGGTNWSLANGLGGGKSDAFQAGLYGATRSGPGYLAAAFAFTNHWMSTDRFAFAGDHLTARFNAQSYGGRVESGYRFATYYGGITPYAAIQAQSFRTPGYSETDTNGGGFGLAYNSRTGTDTRSELGARFDRLLAVNPNAVLTLRARLAWAHDWVSDPALAAVFQALPGAGFVVNGAAPAKDSALASAGIELRLANGISLLGKFDGEFASRSSTYAGTGTVRYAW